MFQIRDVCRLNGLLSALVVAIFLTAVPLSSTLANNDDEERQRALRSNEWSPDYADRAKDLADWDDFQKFLAEILQVNFTEEQFVYVLKNIEVKGPVRWISFYNYKVAMLQLPNPRHTPVRQNANEHYLSEPFIRMRLFQIFLSFAVLAHYKSTDDVNAEFMARWQRFIAELFNRIRFTIDISYRRPALDSVRYNYVYSIYEPIFLALQRHFVHGSRVGTLADRQTLLTDNMALLDSISAADMHASARKDAYKASAERATLEDRMAKLRPEMCNDILSALRLR